MNKIILAKRNSAIFLATLLVIGTIATILPSTQAQPYYEEEYYQEYPSYNDNNDYKSKDSSSTIVKKIKCNNINSNNNGVDVSLGVPNNDDAIAEAQAADDEGQETTANEWGYGNEYKQKDNGFKFVCVNNNDNENNVVVVNGTTPEPPIPPEPPITCEECFTENLRPEQLEEILEFFETTGIIIFVRDEPIRINSFAELCAQLQGLSPGEVLDIVERLSGNELDFAVSIILCLDEVFDFNISETTVFDINTDINTNDLQITQETQDSSALEKIEKLKSQWLDLLP